MIYANRVRKRQKVKVYQPVGGRQAGNCRHERHGRALGGCGEAGHLTIVGSEGRGICRVEGEWLERTVGHCYNPLLSG